MESPLVRRSTHEDVVEELTEEKEEAEEQREEEHIQRSLLATGITAALKELPKIEPTAGYVETLEQPHIAFKAVDSGIATLIIPEGARVVSPTLSAQVSNIGPSKYRTDEAVVVGIREYDITISVFSSSALKTDKQIGDGSSLNEPEHNSVTYRIGETVTPDYLDENTSTVCTNGIHFFAEKDDAVEWLRT